MDPELRLTKKYGFKNPDLSKLKELAAHVTDYRSFQRRYGKLLEILHSKVEDGLLNVLLQFYDPLYHCFTFRDYQLVPTLEEYAYHFGLLVNEKTLYNGYEDELKLCDLANVLSLDVNELKRNWVDTKKPKAKGIWAKFLFQKAFHFAEKKNARAVETIFALLMYGLVLFPDVPGFIDYKAIQIFLIGNPVPTLLADAHYGIYHKVLKGKGVVVCCSQFLRNWFVTHLPRSPVFKQNPEGLSWSQRIMSITSEDVKWYNDFYDSQFVIDRCGEFANVPLIGTLGGITYNPSLARRQFGFPMAKAPANNLLERHFYTDGEESSALKRRFMLAWEKVHKVEMKALGKTNCVAGKSYKDWIANRVAEFGMPYALEEPIRVIEVPSLTQVLFKTKDELKVLLTRMTEDRDAWKAKFLDAEREKNKWKTMHDSLDEERLGWELTDRAQVEEIASLKKRIRNK